jgi:effector-binding domain-containing protein
MGEVYGQIFQQLAAEKVGVAGPPLAIYYEMPHGDAPMEMEIAVPVNRDVKPVDGMMTHVLDAATVVTAVYQGPYHEIGPAYDAIMNWVAEHGYAHSGPPREAYLNGPDEVKEPSDLLTEVAFPVRKLAA